MLLKVNIPYVQHCIDVLPNDSSEFTVEERKHEENQELLKELLKRATVLILISSANHIRKQKPSIVKHHLKNLSINCGV